MSLPMPKQDLGRSVRLLLQTSIMALTLFAAATSFAQTKPNIAMRGYPTIGAPGVMRTTADIMMEQDLVGGLPHVQQDKPEHDLSEIRANAKQNPASPAVSSLPARIGDANRNAIVKPGAQTYGAQSIGVNFTAATLATTGSFPPDNDGAVGPTQYICGVNGRIISFNKTTGVADGVLNATTNSFFSTVRANSSTSDPMVRYDRLSNRWFVSIINVSTPNRWLLAVSDAASNGVISATTVWTYYYFIPATVSPAISNGSTCLTDYPSLGVDANAVYMGGDQFCGTGQPFQQTDVFVIRKSSVLSGGPIVVTAFRGLMSASTSYVGPFAPRGVDNYDVGTNEGYFIGTDGASYGTLWVYRVADPGGSPTLSAGYALTLPTTNGPRMTPHKGNTNGYWGRIDALDDREFHAVMRNQQLWTSHNIGVDNTGVSTGNYTTDARNASRWYQINVPVGSGNPTIVQTGTLFAASVANDSLQTNYTIPSINVSGQGHAVMGFSASGENDYINAGFAGRLATDPLGTMQAPVLATASATAYNPTSDPGTSGSRPRRWGDYATTSVDPLDDMSMWTVQQFCDASNSYGVRITRVLAPPPATPATLADVVASQSSFTVTLTGTSSNGSGFFDPGANLPSPARAFNHISASCFAGNASGTAPTVTSVSYVSPTSLSITFNTTNATPNLAGQFYSLTVTNPDGQSSTAAIVHVVPAIATITASSNTGGSISPSGATQVTYGASQAYAITPDPCNVINDVKVDGVSVGRVSAYTFSNVNTNHTIAATFFSGLPDPVAIASVQQVKSGNGNGGRTGIKVQFTTPYGAKSVEVWRKGYGNYPRYNSGGIVAPTSYPPAGWTLTNVQASGDIDVPPTRDVWFYVLVGRDSCGNASPLSQMIGGVLDYHLGDVSDGVTPGQGDNVVNAADASLLGAHYGASGSSLVGFEYLDVGPTSDRSTNTMPNVDGVVDFEDLIMFVLNYTPKVSEPARVRPVVSAPLGEAVSIRTPVIVQAGETFDVPVSLSAGGSLQGLSVALDWDRSVATPEGMVAGDLVPAQGGMVLSPRAGTVDAALLGAASPGITGEGTLATVRFRALKAGDPHLAVAKVIGRDVANHDVSVTVHAPVAFTSGVATRTDLEPVIPNPTRGSSAVRYSLTTRGRVNVAVYSVDGRLVKTLVSGVQDAGQYQVLWDGADAQGAPAKPGMFFVRFETEGVRKSRTLSVIR